MTKLRAWRESQDFTVRESAALSGISPTMWSRTERGLRQLSPRSKVMVARRLGVNLTDLFELPDAEKSTAA